MDQIYTQLTSRVFKLLNEMPYNHRLIISISGAPNSGKSSVLSKIASLINKIAHRSGFVEYNTDLCVVIPQEGYRIRRPDLVKLSKLNKQLTVLRDVPKLYNSKLFLLLLQYLQQEIDELRTRTVYAPEYNTARDSITENGIKITPQLRVIIIEGSYVQLKDSVWNEIASMVEERWFIRVKTNIGKQRLIKRYISDQIVQSPRDLESMYEDVDLIKRDYIINHTLMPDLIIDSVEYDS